MSNFFIENLKKYGPISENTERELLPYIKHIYKKKGTHLIRKGQLNGNLYILEEGILRFYYTLNDKEITTWFCSENMVAFTSSAFGEMPSFEYLQLLEDSSVYYITGKDLNLFYQTNSEMNIIGRKLSEEYCIEFEERVASLQTLTAQERYDTLLIQTPQILQRIPLGYIASYLGVSQETLSRIRKK